MENDTLTGELTGKLKGIWLEADVDNMIRAGIISGAANGYIDVVEESGAWSAGAVGDWVEVTDLLTTEKLGFTMDQLNTFVSVPITEVYSNILAGSGSIAGGVAMTNTFKDFLNFAFNSWAANKWDASYTGSAGGNPITGQAGGTYNNGTFTGLGAGGTVVDGNITTMNTVTIDGNYAGSVDNPVLSDVTANVTVYAPAETPVT